MNCMSRVWVILAGENETLIFQRQVQSSRAKMCSGDRFSAVII